MQKKKKERKKERRKNPGGLGEKSEVQNWWSLIVPLKYLKVSPEAGQDDISLVLKSDFNNGLHPSL